jgi:hypothetical protein
MLLNPHYRVKDALFCCHESSIKLRPRLLKRSSDLELQATQSHSFADSHFCATLLDLKLFLSGGHI